MASRETNYRLRFGHIRRDSEEQWEVIEPRMIEYWTAAAKCLGEKTYEHQGCTIRVLVDWTPYARRMARDHQIMAAVLTGQWKEGDWYAKVRKALRLKAVCTVTGKNKLTEYAWYPGFFLEYFLYEVFAISNLACPGAANFYSLSIEGITTRSTDEPRLSAFYFEEWMIDSIEGNEPVARILKPDDVSRWLSAVNPHVTQKGETGTQKALFALYQLCKCEGGVVDVLWIFNALESLLSTKVGENFSGLVRRIALVLGLSSSEAASMSKKLRKLYELRSAFVHGGYAVTHPIHSEPIDPRLNSQQDEVYGATKYGFFLLAALLQRMVETSRTSFAFEERLVGADAGR